MNVGEERQRRYWAHVVVLVGQWDDCGNPLEKFPTDRSFVAPGSVLLARNGRGCPRGTVGI